MFIDSYERKLKGNNLILTECEPVIESNIFEEHMITENEIKGFLQCRKRNEDGRDKFVYDITSKQNLRQLYEEREMQEADLKKIITSLINIRAEIENYLLHEENIILNPSYIYADPENRIPSFIFYPYYHMNLHDSMMQLAGFLLERTDHEDEKAVYLAYGFYKGVLNEEYSFDKLLSDYKEAQFRNDKTPLANPEYTESETPLCVSDETGFLEDKSTGKSERIALITSMTILIILIGILIAAKIFEESIADIIGFDERYIVGLFGLLGALSVSIPVIIIAGHYRRDKQKSRYREIARKVYSEADMINRKSNRINRNNKKLGNTEDLAETEMFPRRLVCYEGSDITEFRLNKASFLIGKSIEEADGVLNNPKASRIHAKIQKRNGDYYITDQNSTNGTAVNGRILTANESVKLCVNDEVSFAGEVFYFR